MAFLKKYMYWIIAAILAYIIYIVVKNRNKNAAGGSDSIPGISVPSFKYVPSSVDRAKPFGIGSKDSQEVAYLQTWLNSYHGKTLKVDGDFGSKTSAAWLSVRPATNVLSSTLDSLGI
jgi:peptidoglycan hydrolase-like protein with peptidoglycan-binding domain